MDVRLFEAVAKGDLEAVKFVLNCGGNLKAKDNIGSNLLHAAVSFRQLAIVTFLIELEPHLALKKNTIGRTPLLNACMPYLELDTLKVLVQVKESLNIADDDSNQTALHHVASSYDGLEATRLLIECGADINKLDCRKMSALHLAIKNGNFLTVKLLLEQGAITTYKDFMLLDIRQYWPILKLLLEHKPLEVNTKNPDGYTLLMRFARFGDVIQVKYLLDRGAHVNAVAASGTTALMEAVKACDLDIIKLLLESGANPLHENKQGESVLSLATLCQYSPVEILNFLFNLDEIVKAPFQFHSPDIHPQTVVLRRNRSPEILLFIVNSDYKNVNLMVNEELTNIDFCNIFDYEYPDMALGPISYLLHNPECDQIFDATTRQLLDILLDSNYPLNYTFPKSLPPLTVLLSCEHSSACGDEFIDLVSYLICRGANVSDMSLKLQTTSSECLALENLRQETLLPDALLMAHLCGNIPAVNLLLPYWCAPPLALLLVDQNMTYDNVACMYVPFAEYGLPLGTSISRRLTSFLQNIPKQPEGETEVWKHFQSMLSEPPSLKILSKFAVRDLFARQAFARSLNWGEELLKVCAPGLRAFMDLPPNY